MTERKPLTLSIPSKELQERRAQALRVLSQAGIPPSSEPVLSRSRKRTVIVNPPTAMASPFLAEPPPVPSVSVPVRSPIAPMPMPMLDITPLPSASVAPVPALIPVPMLKPIVIERPPLPERVRLNRRMADLGLCSRREADAWIEKGWVRVNGQVAVMGQQIHLNDAIEVAQEAQLQQEQQVTILLNKPVGYVSGQAEDNYPPAVSLITPRHRWSGDTGRMRFNFKQLQGIAPAGRLDIDSVGLLVLTQDGRVARQLIGEDSIVEKEYLVRVAYVTPTGGVVQHRVQNYFPPERLDVLRHGLSLDGEPLKPAQISWQNPEQLRFVLTEGKKRQIRRMCEQVGLTVIGLKRIRIGGVMLGNLPPGQWRYLGTHERF